MARGIRNPRIAEPVSQTAGRLWSSLRGRHRWRSALRVAAGRSTSPITAPRINGGHFGEATFAVLPPMKRRHCRARNSPMFPRRSPLGEISLRYREARPPGAQFAPGPGGIRVHLKSAGWTTPRSNCSWHGRDGARAPLAAALDRRDRGFRVRAGLSGVELARGAVSTAAYLAIDQLRQDADGWERRWCRFDHLGRGAASPLRPANTAGSSRSRAAQEPYRRVGQVVRDSARLAVSRAAV